jgi:hypothetical protein
MFGSSKKAKLSSAHTSGFAGGAVMMGGASGLPSARQGENAVTLITNTSLLEQGHILGEAGRRSMLRVQAELEAMRAQWLQLINDKIVAIKVVDAATTLAREDERRRKLYTGAPATEVMAGVRSPSKPFSYAVNFDSQSSVTKHMMLLQRAFTEIRYDVNHSRTPLPWRECIPFVILNAASMKPFFDAWALDEERRTLVPRIMARAAATNGGAPVAHLGSDEDDSGYSDTDGVLKTDFDAGAAAAAVNVVALTVTNMPQPSAVDAAVNFTNPPQDKA